MLEESKPASTAMKTFFVMSYVPAMWWSGYAMSTMWKWFMVPLGLPPVRVAAMLGICSMLSFMRANLRAVVERESVEWMSDHYKKAIAVLILGPAVTLGLGRLYLWIGTP